MEATLLKALALASGGLLSIGSILITLLLLSSHRGLAKASAYFLGYLSSYLCIGLAVLKISAMRELGASDDEPSQAGTWVALAIGALLLLFALKTWRQPKDEGPRKIAWLEALDELRARRLLAFGLLIPFINFKNLAIYLSAISIVIEGELPFEQSALIVGAVALFFCSALLAPILLFALGKERAQPLLQKLKLGLEANNRRFTLTLLLVFGSAFTAKGLFGLFG